MLSYLKTWLELKTDRRAVTALEYGLIAALIAVGITASLTALGGSLTSLFNKISTSLG